MLETKLPNAAAHMLTISTTAINLADAINAADGIDADFKLNAVDNAVNIICETNSIRVLGDGNTPTSANGLLLDASGNISGRVYSGADLSKILMIRAGGSDASVYVSLGKLVTPF